MPTQFAIHNLVISPQSERILNQLRPYFINATVHLTIGLNAYLSNEVFEQNEVLLLKVPQEIHEIEKLRLVKTKKKACVSK
jgi:hypothetical protein